MSEVAKKQGTRTNYEMGYVVVSEALDQSKQLPYGSWILCEGLWLDLKI